MRTEPRARAAAESPSGDAVAWARSAEGGGRRKRSVPRGDGEADHGCRAEGGPGRRRRSVQRKSVGGGGGGGGKRRSTAEASGRVTVRRAKPVPKRVDWLTETC